MYHLSEAYLLAAFICCMAAFMGALVFGAATVAPTAVRLLDPSSCAVFLRSFWVSYHKTAVVGGVIMTLILGLGSTFSAVPLLYSTSLTALAAIMTICFWFGLRVIPAINQARDEGNEQAFSRLHRLDLMLVGSGLLLLLSVIVGLVYVLPGQFTFWPTSTG